jgi:hypothetical protein
MLDWEEEYEREQENKMNELTDKDVGVFRILTAHSQYTVNTSKETLCREPGRGANLLRGDDNEVQLVSIRLCKVGRPAYFALSGLPTSDGGSPRTTRGTTEVLSIERIAD